MALKLFPLGAIAATPGALDLGVDFRPFLERHQSGDWGNVSKEDAKENNLSLKEGFRIVSAYTINATQIWIITEADRSVTTILLPSEY